ncbi:MAG TPA: hypothetical protein VLG68_02810 [Gammaproteobacteria bacterium]|nr:hypothetical protein [Gammaproteobacteria bacterium]
MNKGGMILMGLLAMAAALAAGCSPGSGDAYALRGTPTTNSGTSSGNFIISGEQCQYVTMVGFYSSTVDVQKLPCKVISDEADALGDLHTHVTIEITTPKGKQTAKIDGTTAGMIASQTPDLGFAFPPNWAVSALAPTLTLRNAYAGPVQAVVKIQGVECAMTINNAPVTCGLSYWSDGGFSIWVPGLLVSAAYAQYVVGMNFGKNPSGQWTVARPPEGFPPDFTEIPSK